MRLFVGNLNPKVTEEDIQPVFSAFGIVESLRIEKDHNNKSCGYGYVEFRKETDGISACAQLNGLMLLGQKMEVTKADNPGNPQTPGLPMLPGRLEDEAGNAGLALNTRGKAALM